MRAIALICALVPAAAVAADPPRLVGHRALIRHAPEQTLAALNACVDLRLDMEIDVRRTCDGKLVCLHDDTVDRTTTGTGRVTEMSLREVQALDAGRKFDPAFAGERVPMLEELFALLRDRKAANTLIAVDLKAADEAVEADVVALAQKYRVLKQLVFIGRTITEPGVRKRLRAASPAAAVATLTTPEAFADAVADPDAAWVYCRFVPTVEQVKQAHAAGKKVFLAGPLFAGREPDNWAKARAAGVDALLTDFPLECRDGWRAEKP